jgi:glycosyltransferase involved in cell wall biosynthesis
MMARRSAAAPARGATAAGARPPAAAARRLKVLVVAEWYLPGFKAGGPVRTLSGLARLLNGPLEMAVLTRDRDWLDEGPFPGVPVDRWTDRDGVAVRYLSPENQGMAALGRVLRETEYDVVYLNSLFSPLSRRVLLLRRRGAIPDRPVVLAPRGELSPGALRLRGAKKRVFLALTRAAGLYRGVTWQATTPLERDEMRAVLGPGARVEVAPNPSIPPGPPRDLPRPPKEPRSIRLVFLSRFSRKKNLLGALELLRGVEGQVRFDLYGTVEDEPYWERCKAAIARLPANVTCTYHGPVPPERVDEAFAGAHLFFFPTLAENFGHVIVEAMRAGCPVLLSDQTPWRNLAAARAGWDVALDDVAGIHAALRQAIEMDGPTWERWAKGARDFVAAALDTGEVRDAHLRMFRSVAGVAAE